MKKNKFIKKLLLAIVATLYGIHAMAQTTISDAYASLADGTGQNNSFTVVISDTNDISEIEVRLGTELAASDIMLHSFNYDVQPPSPYSYERSAIQIKIGISSITLTDMYYGEVRLKDSNGNWGSPFQFVSN